MVLRQFWWIVFSGIFYSFLCLTSFGMQNDKFIELAQPLIQKIDQNFENG